MSKHEIEFKTLLDKADAAEHLEKLVQCLKAGKIVVEKGDRFVSVSPEERISFSLECCQKKDKEELSVKLSWTPAPPLLDPKNRINISFNEPKVEESQETKDDNGSDESLKIR